MTGGDKAARFFLALAVGQKKAPGKLKRKPGAVCFRRSAYRRARFFFGAAKIHFFYQQFDCVKKKNFFLFI